MARELARRGHSIVVMGRNNQKLANTKRSIEAEPNVGEVITVCYDLSDPSPAEYERIKQEIDPDKRDIGILINSAGTGPYCIDFFDKHDPKHMHESVNITVISGIYLTHMIVPGMLTRERGLIVNISSTLGELPSANFLGVYSPIKHFTSRWSQQLYNENIQFSRPIDVITLHTGFVSTKLLNQHSPSLPVAVDVDKYAKSAINALSARPKTMSGYWAHALLHNLGLVAAFGGFWEYVYVFILSNFQSSSLPSTRKR